MACAVLSGGGTAGHINPALALAEQLVARGWDVYFAGTPKGVEARLVPAAGIPFKAFEASGFDRSRPWTLVSGLYKIQKSTRAAKRWFAEIKPDVVVGFGGYVSVPVTRAAGELGIPVVIHEQNSVMGMSNKHLAKCADAVCLTYGITEKDVADASKVHLTGNPVRREVFSATRAQGRKRLGIPEDARMLLVFGGSLGARHINETIARLAPELLSRKDLYVVHVCGPKGLDETNALLDEALADEDADAKERYITMGYEDEMPKTLAATDAIVSRAGATSLAEISARAIPALLVPYPFATADHQTTNARAYVDAGAAFIVADAELESEGFTEKLFALVDDENVRESMSLSAKALETESAADKLADVVCACANGRVQDLELGQNG